MPTLESRVGRRLSKRSAFPLRPQSAAEIDEGEEAPPPPPTRVGTVAYTDEADIAVNFNGNHANSPTERTGTAAATEQNDSGSADDVGFGIVLRPDRGITGWTLTANTGNTVSNTGTYIQHTAGGFNQGTHISIVERNLPATDNFAAYGRIRVTAVIDTGNINTNVTGYFRALTLDNLPATYATSGVTVGTNTTKWRLGIVFHADGIPQLISAHEGVSEIVLWTGSEQMSPAQHTFDLDFTPSQGAAGQCTLRIDGTTVFSQSGIQTVPSGVDAAHVVVTHVSSGVYDALFQPVKPLSVRTYYMSIIAAVIPIGTVSGSIGQTEQNDAVNVQGNTPGGGGGTVYNRPSNISQVGIQLSITSTNLSSNPGGGTYDRVAFSNLISLSNTTYVFNNCTFAFISQGGYQASLNATFTYCRLRAAMELGGQAGMSGDFCHLIGNDYAYRPKGRNYDGDVVGSTPGTWRSCVFESTGTPSSNSTHCEAVQTIGCADMNFIACWFYIQPRFDTSGNIQNTAAFSHWGGNCLFDRCGFGQYGAAHNMIYSTAGAGNPNNYFNNCVIGVMGNPAGEFPVTGAHFWPGTAPAYKAIVNGVRIT